jgi:ABC-type antimicrobial peptide transport system ATPase subunit
MKKIALLFVTATTLFACKQTEVKTEIPANAVSTNGTVTNSGPDVELIKKSITAFANGDWDTYASTYADSAVAVHNAWPNKKDTTTAVKMPVMIERFKKQRELIDGNLTMGGTIYEVLTMPNGNKYGHLWVKLSWKSKKGVPGELILFDSYGINKDGKISYEWPIYDTKDVVKLGQ